MATITVAKQSGQADVLKFFWETLTESNADGAPVSLPDHPDISVQFTGDFGSGNTSLQGSNDGGTTWAVLHDPFGNLITLTGAGIVQVAERCEQYRPLVNTGSGVDIDVTLIAGRA